jgi:hypothetical protein
VGNAQRVIDLVMRLDRNFFVTRYIFSVESIHGFPKIYTWHLDTGIHTMLVHKLRSYFGAVERTIFQEIGEQLACDFWMGILGVRRFSGQG